MSEKEFFRIVMNKSKNSGGLRFDPNEFNRKATTKKSDEKTRLKVEDALKECLSTGFLSHGGSASSIAAQLQQTLRLFDVEVEMIEAAMTEIVDKGTLKDIASISYRDDGDGVYGDGVRVFNVKKNETTTK